MFKFLHAADLHLDSPLRNLSKQSGAPVEEIRQATRRALENLVRCALDEDVAFVLIAGDVYDGDWDNYDTGHFFGQQMSRLHRENIPVYLISGNHDAANNMTHTLLLPPNVTSFSTQEPQTFHLENLPVSLHGQGFATRSVKQDLSANYPPAVSGRFNIGLLHTSVDGREGHDDYAPCSLNGLASKAYDYWALGHIHKREILNVQNPMVAFSGNIQGRHIGETGPKGCLVVEVGENRQIVNHRFQSLDVFRWEVCEIDLSQAVDDQDVHDLARQQFEQILEQVEDRPAAVRVILTGASQLHDALYANQTHWTEQIRAMAAQQSAEKLWIENVKLKTKPVNAARKSAELDGPIAELSACVKEWSESEDQLQCLRESLKSVRNNIPVELLSGPDALRLDDPKWIMETLQEAEKLVTGRLLNQEESQ